MHQGAKAYLETNARVNNRPSLKFRIGCLGAIDIPSEFSIVSGLRFRV